MNQQEYEEALSNLLEKRENRIQKERELMFSRKEYDKAVSVVCENTACASLGVPFAYDGHVITINEEWYETKDRLTIQELADVAVMKPIEEHEELN